MAVAPLYQLHRGVVDEALLRRHGGSLEHLAALLGCNRSTFWRWLRPAGTLPRDEATFLRFAAALDVDPFALWDVAPSTFPRLATLLLRGAREKPTLRHLHAHLRPQKSDWPSAAVAKFYGRSWYVERQRHAGTGPRSFYQRFQLRWAGDGPRAWHFASIDRSGPVSGAVTPLGVVLCRGGQAELLSTNGIVQRVAHPTGARTLAVSLWQGRGAAESLIASLHAFTLEVQPDGAATALRFCQRGEQCGQDDCGARLGCEADIPMSPPAPPGTGLHLLGPARGPQG